MEFTLRNNNGPVLLFKTIFRHQNCFLSSVAADGKDEHGLKLEKGGPTLTRFNAMPAKITKSKKILFLVLLMKFFISFSYRYTSILCMGEGT